MYSDYLKSRCFLNNHNIVRDLRTSACSSAIHCASERTINRLTTNLQIDCSCPIHWALGVVFGGDESPNYDTLNVQPRNSYGGRILNAPHYFQRYSQRENVVTNNTLQLFYRLYTHNPYRFSAFINKCLNIPLDIGILFDQQTPNPDSTPDGSISQTSFKVVIETKLDQSYDRDQLKRHLSAFTDTDENEKHQILLLLGDTLPSDEFVRKVRKDVQTFNKDYKRDIHFVATTFEAIIKSFESVLSDFDFQMKEIAEDFRAFLQEEGLLGTPYRMRGCSCWGYVRRK